MHDRQDILNRIFGGLWFGPGFVGPARAASGFAGSSFASVFFGLFRVE